MFLGTWELSFELVRKTKSHATRELLSVMVGLGSGRRSKDVSLQQSDGDRSYTFLAILQGGGFFGSLGSVEKENTILKIASFLVNASTEASPEEGDKPRRNGVGGLSSTFIEAERSRGNECALGLGD